MNLTVQACYNIPTCSAHTAPHILPSARKLRQHQSAWLNASSLSTCLLITTDKALLHLDFFSIMKGLPFENRDISPGKYHKIYSSIVSHAWGILTNRTQNRNTWRIFSKEGIIDWLFFIAHIITFTRYVTRVNIGVNLFRVFCNAGVRSHPHKCL